MKGKEVRKKLKEGGYILANIANSMGTTQQNLNNLLNADDIKTGTIERIAVAINKSIYWFYSDSDSQISQIGAESAQKQVADTAKLIEVLTELNDVRKELQATKDENARLMQENIMLKKGGATERVIATGTDQWTP